MSGYTGYISDLTSLPVPVIIWRSSKTDSKWQRATLWFTSAACIHLCMTPRVNSYVIDTGVPAVWRQRTAHNHLACRHHQTSHWSSGSTHYHLRASLEAVNHCSLGDIIHSLQPFSRSYRCTQYGRPLAWYCSLSVHLPATICVVALRVGVGDWKLYRHVPKTGLSIHFFRHFYCWMVPGTNADFSWKL